MRDSPAAAFAFLMATILIPMALGYAAIWWLLQYTNTGLLVYKREVAAASPEATGRQAAETVLHCSYFTGSQVLLREFSTETQGDDGDAPAAGCPWRIEAS